MNHKLHVDSYNKNQDAPLFFCYIEKINYIPRDQSLDLSFPNSYVSHLLPLELSFMYNQNAPLI